MMVSLAVAPVTVLDLNCAYIVFVHWLVLHQYEDHNVKDFVADTPVQDVQRLLLLVLPEQENLTCVAKLLYVKYNINPVLFVATAQLLILTVPLGQLFPAGSIPHRYTVTVFVLFSLSFILIVHWSVHPGLVEFGVYVNWVLPAGILQVHWLHWLYTVAVKPPLPQAHSFAFDHDFQFTVFAVLHTLLCHVKLFAVGIESITLMVAVLFIEIIFTFLIHHVNV